MQASLLTVTGASVVKKGGKVDETLGFPVPSSISTIRKSVGSRCLMKVRRSLVSRTFRHEPFSSVDNLDHCPSAV
jgi:hypothetical protein